jgi:hypothetical protein
MQYGLDRYHREHPEVDILVIEPLRHEMQMFRYNIMRYGVRRVIAEHGYRSVVLAFRQNRGRYERLLKRHGIGMRDPFSLPEVPHRSTYSSTVTRRLGASLERLDAQITPSPRRRGASRTRRIVAAPAGRR